MLSLPTFPADNTYAVGDIHGCSDTLKALIGQLPLNDQSVLIFLGDYVDRGPDSRGVIDYLIDLSGQQTCYFLRGNHEDMMLHAMETGNVTNWLMNGAKETLMSYGATTLGSLRLPDSHLTFLKNTLYYIDTPGFLFVHAGANPDQTLADSIKNRRFEDFIWSRAHLRARKLKWEKTMVCGHTPHDQAILTDKLILIDTGCVYKAPRFARDMGILTAIQLPSRKLFQADYCETLDDL